jgi:hypothetical protein
MRARTLLTRGHKQDSCHNDLASDRMAGTASSLSTQLAVQDAKQLRQRLYERCLGARGYERRSD